MLKLFDFGVGQGETNDMVRIGSKSACHPTLQRFLAPEIAGELDGDAFTGKPSTGNLHEVISHAKIIGTTALTASKTPLLLGEHFDIVIVDEAGQISQPAILGPLMTADSFLLVGDHEQLPPLVQSESAEKAGMFCILFHSFFTDYDLITGRFTNLHRIRDLNAQALGRRIPLCSCATHTTV